MLSRVPPMLEVARRAEEHVKGMFARYPSSRSWVSLFPDRWTGMTYRRWFRPCTTASAQGAATVACGHPQRQGYPPAEDEPVGYHMESVFSTRPAGSNQPGRAAGRAIPRCSGNGCAIWPSGTSV